jgi:hypothetical protein
MEVSDKAKKIKLYVVEVAVLSEILSIVQSVITVLGGNPSYFNLLFFFVFCAPVFFQVRMSKKMCFVLMSFILFVVVKLFLQGVGEYYQKSLVVLFSIPFYLVVFRHVEFEDIVSVCRKYRFFVMFLGVVYIGFWFFLGTYRNASTVTIFLMLLLGFDTLKGKAVSLLSAFVMKTQYKIWLVVSLFGLLVRDKLMMSVSAVIAGFFAVGFPVVILFVDLGWVGFSDSELSSLGERLREVCSFISAINEGSGFYGFGWPIGQPILEGSLSERGYMHSAYLWLLGSLGFPVSFLFFCFLFSRKSFSRKSFFVRLFLILSSSLTFFVLTNPFVTALMFSNESKK